jgi:hypothetical protein
MGNVILDVPACCGSGETKPFRCSSCDLLGRPFFRFFSNGTVSIWSRVRVERVALAGCGSGSGKVVFAAPLVCLVELLADFFGSGAISGAISCLSAGFSTGRFLGGRPLLGDGFGAGFSGAGRETSGIVSTVGFDFLDLVRVNWNPSSSSKSTSAAINRG